ncbi:hypothetical protein WDU94_010128 [Cyamophila willieti]
MKVENVSLPSQHISENSTEAAIKGNTSDPISQETTTLQTHEINDQKSILCEKQKFQAKEMLHLKKKTNYFNNLESAAKVDNEDTNRNIMKEMTHENTSDASNCDSSCLIENDFTQVRKRKRRNCLEKDIENNFHSDNANRIIASDDLPHDDFLNKELEHNLDEKAGENNPKKFDFSNEKCHVTPSTSLTDETNIDTPSTSSTDENKIELITFINKKQRKKHGGKKAKNIENDIRMKAQVKNTNNMMNNLATNRLKEKTWKKKSPEVNNFATNTTKVRSPETNAIVTDNTDDNASVVHTNINMPPEPLDISTLVLMSLVSCVLYLLYSTLFLGHVPQASVTLHSEGSVEQLDTTIHDRYTQLVQDWEARVLENTELDYQIALKERSERLQNRRNTTWNSNRSHPNLSLPECLHRNILTHAFVHLRSYPPDIHESSSWNKAKLCVDLAHILSPMRSLPFSAVLRYLLFFLSPTNQINYDTLYEHYVYQQKVHIHEIIRSDYPEIYQNNAFYRPDSKLRPSMYCLSMSRFGLLRNKFAPEEDDNMLALAKLSDLYVQHEECLHEIVKGDGSILDQFYNMILDVLLSRSLSTAITLDPALLHDYYLELILSNETNLGKLSKQLFKYNMLSIQKFNLTLSKEQFTFRKQRMNNKEKEKGHTNGEKFETNHKDEQKFQTFRDGDDEFLVLNKEYKYVDKKEKQNVKKDKHRSLDKTQIEYFYDGQLRKISNGYSSKVAKFLTDINNELKHALCFPYLNVRGENLGQNDEHEPLVRFIRNMCRTNVQQTKENQEFHDRKHNSQTRENQEFKDRKYNTQTRANQECHDNVDRLNGKTKPYSQIVTKQDELAQQEAYIETVDTVSWKVLPNDRREDNTGTFHDTTKPVQNIVNIVPLDNMGTYNDETITTTPSVIHNSDAELRESPIEHFDKGVFTSKDTEIGLNKDKLNTYELPFEESFDELFPPSKETNNDVKESAYENDNVYVEESLKYSNIPDLWIMKQMANDYGLADNDNVFHEKPARVNAYDVKPNQNTEEQIDYNDIDDDETLIQEEIASFIKQNQKYKTQFDQFKRDNARHKHKDGRKKNKGRKYDNDKKGERLGENSNFGNIYDSRNTDKYNNKDNSNYNNKENYDSSHNYNKDNNFKRDNQKDDRKPFHDSSNKEERIVHIDGSDNKYTRHVYIDNINEMEEQEPNYRETYQTKFDRPESRNRRHRSERGGNSEMDFWLNRRASLRAKLRKKTTYPIQNNPEYHYDYLY